MLWHNEEFASGLGNDIALDGVICVVDAVFGRQVCVLYIAAANYVINHKPTANRRG